MVSVSRIEGGPQVLSAGVRKTIQSIKEVVGTHSDADIYLALKEANMDPDETVRKLLAQDPFHEVSRKRDRKKENSGNKSFVAADAWKKSDIVHVPLNNPAHSDRNDQRVFPRENASSDMGVSQAFRVVRDNRVNQNVRTDSRSAQNFVSVNDGLRSDYHVKRPARNVVAVRRDIGGHRQQLGNDSSKHHQNNLSSHITGQDHSLAPSGSLNAASLSEHSNERIISESGIPCNEPLSGSNRASNNHQGRSRQAVGHQKASKPIMEWKPKAAIKLSTNALEAGSPERASPVENCEELKKSVAEHQSSTLQLRVSENQNVIIAPHIQASEAERCQLTFGSFDIGAISIDSNFSTTEGADKLSNEPTESASALTPESSGSVPTLSKHSEIVDEPVHSVESASSDSTDVSNLQPMLDQGSSGPENLENYADVSLAKSSSSPYMPQTLHHEDNELSGSSAYDPEILYDSYFQPTIGDNVVPGDPSTLEVLNSHAISAVPPASIAMVQQQQQHPAQMYPQLHVSPFVNLVPYRQFLSPVYVPPMPIPGYSTNPSYNPLSTAGSFVLMPGDNSHLTSSGAVKYGVQQFEPLTPANPSGFSNFINPTGYAISANGSAAVHNNPSQTWYKENLYASNPQPETSEIWMNTRDHLSLQPASYYSMSMPGHTPHPAYLTSHTTHTSFNATAAAAQSSHMQFPAFYTPQEATIQLGRGIDTENIGYSMAAPVPGAQVGAAAYQQTHLNWP